MEKIKGHILLVEDDKNFAMVLKSYLEIHFLKVDVVTNGSEALKLLKDNNYDLCILDVVMPIMDGYELAKLIKKNYPQLKFIFLTSRNLKEDILTGYELGAIDYLCKPFDSEILLVKVNALMDKVGSIDISENEEIHIGNYIFNPSFRTLSINNTSKKLTIKESKLLQLLYQHKNKVLSRDVAQNIIWGDDSYFIGRSMDVFVSKLRKYLSEDSRISIENIRSEGFSLRIDD